MAAVHGYRAATRMNEAWARFGFHERRGVSAIHRSIRCGHTTRRAEPRNAKHAIDCAIDLRLRLLESDRAA